MRRTFSEKNFSLKNSFNWMIWIFMWMSFAFDTVCIKGWRCIRNSWAINTLFALHSNCRFMINKTENKFKSLTLSPIPDSWTWKPLCRFITFDICSKIKQISYQYFIFIISILHIHYINTSYSSYYYFIFIILILHIHHINTSYSSY